ncbi:hypothetical protein SISSUDRAFT_1038162, partial [Sistotremastrum suecicum HHB10207 ss-3]
MGPSEGSSGNEGWNNKATSSCSAYCLGEHRSGKLSAGSEWDLGMRQHIRQLAELASSHIRKASQSLSTPTHIADLEFLDSLMAAFKRPEQYSSERKFASLRAVGEDVQLEDVTKIGGIMYVNGNHYTAYVLDTKHHSLMYGDSNGNPIPEREKSALQWWLQRHTGTSKTLKLVPLDIGSQDDATSCGIVALNALLHHFLPSQFPLFQSLSKTYLACKRIETCFEIADMSLKWTSAPAVQLEVLDSSLDTEETGGEPVQSQPSDVKQAEPKEPNNDSPAPSGLANLSPSNPFAQFVTSKALSFGAKSTKSSSGSSKKKLDDLPQSTLPFQKISDDAYALQVSKGLESVSEGRTTWEEHAEGVRRAKRESLRDYDRERKQKQRHEQKEKDRVAGIRDDDLRLIKKLPTKIVFEAEAPKTHPQGRKTHPDGNRAQRRSDNAQVPRWFSPTTWVMIEEAVKDVGKPWGPTAIANKLKGKSEALFGDFHYQRISDWRRKDITDRFVWTDY